MGALRVSPKAIGALSAGSGAFVHGHTYQARPIACAAALEVQRVIREEGLLAKVQAIGARLGAALLDRFGNHAHVGDIRGRGLVRGLELVADRTTRAPFDPTRGVGSRFRAAGLADGIELYPVAERSTACAATT